MKAKTKDYIYNVWYTSRFMLPHRTPSYYKSRELYNELTSSYANIRTNFVDNAGWILEPGHGTYSPASKSCALSHNLNFNCNSHILSVKAGTVGGCSYAENTYSWNWKDGSKFYMPCSYSSYFMEWHEPLGYGEYHFLVNYNSFVDAWPAIWLWDSNNKLELGDFFYQEIDVVEIFNKNGTNSIWCNTIIGDQYEGADSYSKRIRCVRPNATTRVYSLYWKKDSIIVKVDNKIAYINTHLVPNRKLRLTISSGVSKHGNQNTIAVGNQKKLLGKDFIHKFTYVKY